MNQVTEWYAQKTKEATAATKLLWVTGIGIVGFVVAPAIFLAIKGVIGLVALGVVGMVALVAVNLAPRFTRYLTMRGNNFLLGKMKQEAEINPIETRQNNWLQWNRELQAAKEALTTQEAEIMGFERTVKSMKEKFPDQDSSDMQAALDTMQNAFQEAAKQYQVAVKGLAEMGRINEFLSIKWQASITSKKIMAALGGDQNKLLDKLLSETAAKAVDTQFDKSMAALRMSLNNTRDTTNVIDSVVVPAPRISQQVPR